MVSLFGFCVSKWSECFSWKQTEIIKHLKNRVMDLGYFLTKQRVLKVSQNNIELEISKKNFCWLFSSSKFSFPRKQAIKARWTVELFRSQECSNGTVVSWRRGAKSKSALHESSVHQEANNHHKRQGGIIKDTLHGSPWLFWLARYK